MLVPLSVEASRQVAGCFRVVSQLDCQRILRGRQEHHSQHPIYCPKHCQLAYSTANFLQFSNCRTWGRDSALSTGSNRTGVKSMAQSGGSGLSPGDTPSLLVEFDLDAPLLQDPEREKLDKQDDFIFYERPRFVNHADEGFVDKLSALYKEHLADGMRILDLMSSWQSHLPESIFFRHVAGHGLNRAELLANKRLDDAFVQDLNTNQKLPLADASFNAVLCALSVQYLQYPEQVFGEAHRVLAPSGVFIISFSQHCFKEKAIAGWLNRSLHEQVELVTKLLRRAGFTQIDSRLPRALESWEPRQISDPFCAVIATKSPVLARKAPLEEGYQYRSFASETLRDAGQGGTEPEEEASDRLLEMWVAAYREMQSEAEGLGIPRSAIPDIQSPITPRTIRDARDLLRDIIESRMSSNL